MSQTTNEKLKAANKALRAELNKMYKLNEAHQLGKNEHEFHLKALRRAATLPKKK